MAPSETPRRRGRPPAASREAALRAGLARYLRGDRIDVSSIAAELGLSRNTMHVWFGSRERLIGELIRPLAKELLERCRAEAEGVGGAALLDTFDRYNRALATAPALRAFVGHEREVAMRILTDRKGDVEQASVANIAELIEAEVAAGTYRPPVEPQLLAYAIVRLAETFLFNEHALATPGELDRLREVEAALLHVDTD